MRKYDLTLAAVMCIAAIAASVAMAAPQLPKECGMGQGACVAGVCCPVEGSGSGNFIYVTTAANSPICTSAATGTCPSTTVRFPCQGSEYIMVPGLVLPCEIVDINGNPVLAIGPGSCPIEQCRLQ